MSNDADDFLAFCDERGIALEDWQRAAARLMFAPVTIDGRLTTDFVHPPTGRNTMPTEPTYLPDGGHYDDDGVPCDPPLTPGEREHIFDELPAAQARIRTAREQAAKFTREPQGDELKAIARVALQPEPPLPLSHAHLADFAGHNVVVHLRSGTELAGALNSILYNGGPEPDAIYLVNLELTPGASAIVYINQIAAVIRKAPR